MKMMKSLILGTAVAFAATAGAQAADLPVKAKPVEYVKICSAYGAGFYYIPGTDICLRVGGYIFMNFDVNAYAAGPQHLGAVGGDQVRNRNDNWTSFRVRQDIIFDARTNTEYGTLRAYASTGFQWTTNAGGFYQLQSPAATGNYAWYYDRAFIQFAGLTFGYIGSFFDYDPSMIINQQSSKSFKFTPAIAYTAQFGNGVSASLSLEDSTTRRTQITTSTIGILNGGLFLGGFGYFAPPPVIGGGCSAAAIAAGQCGNFIAPVAIANSGFNGSIYSAQYMPDIVANMRVDQAWGDAQISGALHQVKMGIVGPGPNAFIDAGGGAGVAGLPWAPSKWGYAVLAGINLKLPQLGAGDSFQIEGAWAKGAVDYTGLSGNPYSTAGALGYRKGAIGPVIDLFDSYVNASGQHLATAWSMNAQLRHFWTPTMRSTLHYGYNRFEAPAASQNFAGAAGSSQNFPSGKIHQITANLIWSPVPKLDLGVEAMWNKVETDCGGLAAAACDADFTRGKSADFWGGLFRARRDF